MKEKKHFIITLAITIIITIIELAFFTIPRMIELNALKEESGQYIIKKASVLQANKNKEALEKEIADLNFDINVMKQKLIKYSSLSNIVKIIHREFNKYNVKINSISPVMSSYLEADKNVIEGSINRLPLEMRLEAKFFDFMHLLENSDNLSFFIHPDQISIIKNNNSSEALSIEFRASIYLSKEL